MIEFDLPHINIRMWLIESLRRWYKRFLLKVMFILITHAWTYVTCLTHSSLILLRNFHKFSAKCKNKASVIYSRTKCPAKSDKSPAAAQATTRWRRNCVSPPPPATTPQLIKQSNGGRAFRFKAHQASFIFHFLSPRFISLRSIMRPSNWRAWARSPFPSHLVINCAFGSE